MKNFLHYIYVALMLTAGIALASCIKNDLPYPRIPQLILGLGVADELKPALIDSVNYTATVYLPETIDIRNVSFSEFRISEGATADPDLLEGSFDMSSPLIVTLSLYQDYPWIVSAEQEIERYLDIEGQIGETVIDAVGRRILVRVPETADLEKLNLTSIKLGPAGLTTLSPDIVPGPIDLSRPLLIKVTCWDRTEDWTIYVEKTELIVQTTSVDAWSQVIWAYGSGPADVKNSFQYREAASNEWIDVDIADVSQTQGAFSVCIHGLKPLTDYVVRTVSGDNYGNEVSVTTQATEVLPDGSFDQWWLNGRIWCPWNQDGERFWDTGNTGAATLGQSNVVPSDDTPAGISGQSAKLETKFVGIAGIGKLAAGSIYTGSFKKVDGTNGILDFGRPWTLRPTRLRGYMKYKTAPINYASADYKYLMDRPDSCHIYIAMTDWPQPYEIRTNPNNRQLFNPQSPEVIAYGELIVGHDTDWQEFEIRLNYRSTSRVPRYMQITCAASKYGDFFTGGAGACLYVDDFSLLYDY